jgi:hypothetical protein
LRHRTSAHGEDITVDTANAGSCTLIRFDGAWVVVRFDFESASHAIADVDQTCVFLSRFNEHVWTILW